MLFPKNQTVAVAESMTGGLLSHRFTQNPGASAYFLGGIVAYSSRSKVQLLGVDPKALEQKGAVSEMVARQMAEGALHAFGSDWALAITGIAGPSGGSREKPIGTVCYAISGVGRDTLAWTHLHKEVERKALMVKAADHLLERWQSLL
jgi:nicotinamide-nucleotide amidase